MRLLGLVSGVSAGVVLPALVLVSGSTARTLFQPASHRNPPLVKNVGAEGKPLRIVTIIPKGYPDAGALSHFGSAIVSSTWLRKVSRAWGIPRPAVAGGVLKVDDLPVLDRNRSVGFYQDYVFRKARKAGITKLADHQTIYLVFIPCDDPFGMDPFGCASHHPKLDPARQSPNGVKESKLFTLGDSMAVVLSEEVSTLDTGSGSTRVSTLDGNTVPASHEIEEAATDTAGVGRWKLHTDFPNRPYVDGTAWVRTSGTIETADLAEGTRWDETAPTGETFRYQRIYSNAASQAGGDPDVPPSPNPYYNVSVAADWLSATGNDHATIPVNAWSTAAIGKWPVTAKVVRWRGKSSGAADPCSLPTKSWNVRNGTNLAVTVDLQPVSVKRWCTIEFTSTKSFPQGDDRHVWVVGVILGP